ncbi:MAG: alpha-keto acid decarboxylase family protein [Nitrososphaeraceae archaeon]
MKDLGQQNTVSSFLVQQLYNLGVRHVFGVPGDYVLRFYQYLNESKKLMIINTCDEQGAGFAADAYARINGLGVVCITYCVGGLKVVNATAQAFAEKSPLVIISGSPGITERIKNPLLHHKIRDFDTQFEIFKHITVDSAVISDPPSAVKVINRVLLSAMRYKRPVYLELPRDKVLAPLPFDGQEDEGHTGDRQITDNNFIFKNASFESDIDSLKEAINEAKEMIKFSRKPVIVAGVEIHRFGLQHAILTLIEKTGIPVVSTVLSKSVVSETNPLYLGVYEGAMGHEWIRRYVESSDCLVLLGAPMTDIDFSITPTPIDQSKVIYATSERLSIKHHNFDNVYLNDFLNGLIEVTDYLTSARHTLGASEIEKIKLKHQPKIKQELNRQGLARLEHDNERRKKITVRYLFERLSLSVNNSTVVIADTGDSLFGSLDLIIHDQTEFLCPAYYLSMGFAVPAAIGAQLANSRLRPLVIVGDGAFQMTGMEVSTIARFGLNPIVVILNNKGYGTERPIIDGPFNDLLSWDYSRIPQVIGYGKGFVIESEEELDRAMFESEKIYDRELCLLDVRLDKRDGSAALKRITEVFHSRAH